MRAVSKRKEPAPKAAGPKKQASKPKETPQTKKRGRPLGWRKPNTADDFLHLRCPKAVKETYVAAASERGQDITEWVLAACDAAVRRQGIKAK